MTYRQFLSNLLDHGHVTVPAPAPLNDFDEHDGDKLLADFELQYRAEMPGNPPPFSGSAARWAGVRFYRACQFAVHRDVGEEVINREFGKPFSEPITPGVHYSVDLAFRFLPDLVKFARSAAERDPLPVHLTRWAQDWPLSSVGMEGIGQVKIDAIAASSALMRLYADRIIARNDKSRLNDPRACAAVQSALGGFPELATELAKEAVAANK